MTAGQLGQDPAGLGKADVGALARRAVLEGTVVRRSGRIVFKDEAGKPALRWKFTNAWPKQYSASSLSGTATEVAIEELLVVVEGFELGAVGHAITGQAPTCPPVANASTTGALAQNGATSMRSSPSSIRIHAITEARLAVYAVTSQEPVTNPQVSARAITVSGRSAVDRWTVVPSYTSRIPSCSRSRRRGPGSEGRTGPGSSAEPCALPLRDVPVRLVTVYRAAAGLHSPNRQYLVKRSSVSSASISSFHTPSSHIGTVSRRSQTTTLSGWCVR